jgi:hypothetical protein
MKLSCLLRGLTDSLNDSIRNCFRRDKIFSVSDASLKPLLARNADLRIDLGLELEILGIWNLGLGILIVAHHP